MIEIDFNTNQEALNEWIEYREAKKKPLSDLALKKVIKKLSAHSFDHQQHMVDQAIENDWKGLHEIEPRKKIQTQDSDFLALHTDTSWADSIEPKH